MRPQLTTNPALPAAAPPRSIVSLATFWWCTLPRRIARISPTAAILLLDGSFVSASTYAAALAPLAALAVGGLLGWGHLDYPQTNSTVYIYSLVTLAVLIVVSFHGAALACYAWVGYAAADFFLYALAAPDVANRASGAGRLVQIVETRALADLLLAFLIVVAPFAVRSAVRLSFGWPRTRPAQRWAAPLSAAVLAFAVVYLWIQSAGLLLQAVYIWQDYQPMTHNLVQVRLPDWMLPLAAVAAYVTAVGIAIEDGLGGRSHTRQMAIYQGVMSAAPATRSAPRELVRALMIAAALTLLLGSVIRSWSNAALLLAVNAIVLAGHALAAGMVPAAWRHALSKVPALARLAVLVAAGYLIAQLTFQTVADSFVATQAAAVAGLVVAAILFPAGVGVSVTASGARAR